MGFPEISGDIAKDLRGCFQQSIFEGVAVDLRGVLADISEGIARDLRV